MKIECPACNGIIDFDAAEKKTYPSDNKESFSCGNPSFILFCHQCRIGLAYPMPSPSALAQHYEGRRYWKYEKVSKIRFGNYPLACALAESRLETILDCLKKNSPSSEINLLDIGAGHGFLGFFWAGKGKVLNQAVLKSYTVVEPDQVVTLSLQKTWSDRFKNVPLAINADLSQVGQKFNLIALSHLLEHMINPAYFLTQVTQKLEKDGLIFIEVPHRDDQFKSNAFPHLLFFDQESLSRLVRLCQLEPILFEICGRPRDESPANYRYKKSISFFLEIIIRKTRRILPYGVSKRFYSWYFGVNRQSGAGTWLRVLAKKRTD